MLKIETGTGFKCKVDENVLNRYSFVKLLSKLDKNPAVITELVTMLLGDQEEALITHLGGDPSIEDISKEITDIFNAIKDNNDAKKS